MLGWVRRHCVMATNSIPDVQAFYLFLGERLDHDRVEESPEELLQEWRALHGELSETAEGLREAIADMEAGDRGRPLHDVADEIRKKHNFSSAHDV